MSTYTGAVTGRPSWSGSRRDANPFLSPSEPDTKGMSMSLQPHHDGSATYVPEQEPALGQRVPVFVRVPAGADVRQVHVRTTGDGEPRFAEAVVDRTEGGDTWWRADVEVRNPVSNYRFLLDGRAGCRWLNAAGLVDHDVPDHGDFKLVSYAPPRPGPGTR